VRGGGAGHRSDTGSGLTNEGPEEGVVQNDGTTPVGFGPSAGEPGNNGTALHFFSVYVSRTFYL